MADTIAPGSRCTGSLRLKVLDSPLVAVEAALDGGIGVRCAERPITFDGRQLSRIKLMSRPASGPAQPQGGTPSEPIVSRDATESASWKVNELKEQLTARRRLPADYSLPACRIWPVVEARRLAIRRRPSASWRHTMVSSPHFLLPLGYEHHDVRLHGATPARTSR